MYGLTVHKFIQEEKNQFDVQFIIRRIRLWTFISYYTFFYIVTHFIKIFLELDKKNSIKDCHNFFSKTNQKIDQRRKTLN